MPQIVLACLLWGTTGVAAAVFPDDVAAVTIGAATMGAGGLLLALIGGRRSLGVVRDRGARRWLVVGAVAVVVYPLAFYPSMSLAGVAVGNLVSLGSAPVFAALLEGIVERRPPGRRWAVSAVVALIGLGVLSAAKTGGGDDLLVGIALGALAGASYATYTYASRRVLERGHAPRGAIGAVFGAAAVVLLPVLALGAGPILADGRAIALTAYLVLGPTVLAYLAFASGLRRVRSSSATLTTLLEPCVATALALLLLGERIAPFGAIGMVLLAGAVLALALPPASPARAGAPSLHRAHSRPSTHQDRSVGDTPTDR